MLASAVDLADDQQRRAGRGRQRRRPEPASVVTMRRSSGRLAFSTTSTGVEAARPAAISRAAMPAAVERPM